MGLSTYTIAEIACAHCGDLEVLNRLIKNVNESSFSAVKLQVYSVTALCTKEVYSQTKLVRNQISKAKWKPLFDQIKLDGFKKDIIIEPYDEDSYDFIQACFTPSAIKVPTSDTLNKPLILKILKTGVPIIIGTGGSTLTELDTCIDFIKSFKNDYDIKLVHGFQSFPTNLEDSDLWKINFLKNRYELDVGFADHASADDPKSQILASTASLFFGASFIEKHITLDRSLKESDYYSAIQPDEFTNFHGALTQAEALMNINILDSDKPSDQYDLNANESKYRENMKKFACAARDLYAGHTINDEDVEFKRAKMGQFLHKDINKIVGRKLLKDLKFESTFDASCLG